MELVFMVLVQVEPVALLVRLALLPQVEAVVQVAPRVASALVLQPQVRLAATVVHTVEVRAVALPTVAHTAEVRLFTTTAFLSRREIPTR